jgi:hypothetical protein
MAKTYFLYDMILVKGFGLNMRVCNIADYAPCKWLAYLHVYVMQQHGWQ